MPLARSDLAVFPGLRGEGLPSFVGRHSEPVYPWLAQTSGRRRFRSTASVVETYLSCYAEALDAARSVRVTQEGR